MNDTDFWTVVTILGMTGVTLLTRSFFFLSSRPWRMPGWVQSGLQYAPIAALAAVIAPEILMSDGRFLDTWADARLFAAAAGAAWYFWRGELFGTILVGMAVYLPLHIGLGW